MLSLEEIVFDMCEGQYADNHHNVASETKIPRNLLFSDMMLYRNMCPLGHKTTKAGLVPQFSLRIPQRFLVLYSRDHMAIDSEILGRSAPSGS
jgi:hypothetical protein